MKKTIHKDTPLAELTLRKYEKPANLSDRELIRKLCLTLGLLQPGDSRDIIVDIFYVMIKSKKEISSEEVREQVIKSRKQMNLPLIGIASSNIRRQLKRLRNLFFVEKIANTYRIAEKSSLTEIFEEKIERFLLQSIISRTKEYIKKVDDSL